MEFIMQKNHYFPMTLIAVAILSGCSSIPQNSSLTEAHGSYDRARTNPQVTNLAPLELKEAGDSLAKADTALSKGESEATVTQLAYIAKQQVGIAQETAKRKTSELAVTNASAKRDQVRLEARTAEADAAKQQVAIVQETADQQAAALTAASAKAGRDQVRLEAKTAEADAAKRQAAIAQATADQQAAALTAASAKAERDQALIAQQEIQLKELDAKKTARGMVITLGDVLFSTNKAQLASGGMHNMQKLADFLKQYPQQKVLVEGYTDSTGSNSHNQELSDRRANAVRTALLDMGTSSDRVTTRGYGEAFPVASNDTAASRQLNRRVEIILSDANGNIAPR
jgi:outer membrane protein OmpA-like peptidoglycan-associated protein